MSGTTNLTLKQRRKMQGIAMPAPRAERSGKKELSKSVALLILLLAFGVGVAAGMIYFRPDQRIADLNQMEAVMNEARGDMPSDVRDFLEEQSMTIRDQLPRQRDDRRGSGFIGRFFNMAPADQLAFLQRMEERRSQFEQRRAQQAQQSGGANASGQASNSSGNNNRNGGRRGGMDNTQRTERMEQHLAQRPPQQRGQFTLMRQMGSTVRQQMNSK